MKTFEIWNVFLQNFLVEPKVEVAGNRNRRFQVADFR